MPTITVPAKMTHLAEVQAYLKASVPEAYRAQTANVLLVAEELLVNVFSYAYEEGETQEARITLETVTFEGRERLELTVRDWGRPFNPFEEAPVPDITLDVQSRPIGGLGIFLIKKVSVLQRWTYEDASNFIRILFAPDQATRSGS